MSKSFTKSFIMKKFIMRDSFLIILFGSKTQIFNLRWKFGNLKLWFKSLCKPITWVKWKSWFESYYVVIWVTCNLWFKSNMVDPNSCFKKIYDSSQVKLMNRIKSHNAKFQLLKIVWFESHNVHDSNQEIKNLSLSVLTYDLSNINEET